MKKKKDLLFFHRRKIIALFMMTFVLFLYDSQSQNSVIRLDTPTKNSQTGVTQSIVFQNQTYNSQFIYSTQIFNCSQCKLFTYQQSPRDLDDNAPCFLYLENFTSYPTIKISTFYNFFEPQMYDQQCSTILKSATPSNPKSCILKIINNCPNPVSLFNYFDTIQIQIQGYKSISYNLLCDSSYRTNTFQAGTIILILFVTILITILAVYSSSSGLKNNRISVNLYVIGILAIILIIFEAFSFVVELQKPLRIFMTVLNFIFGIPGLAYCFNQIFYLCKNPFFEAGIKVMNKFTFRIIHAVCILLAIGVMCSWWFLHKNWIMNDIICVSMIIMLARIFKFQSLKIALLYIGLIIFIALTDIIVAKVKGSQGGQSFFINHINNAFQLQIPTINPVFNQRCSWLNMFEIAYPGMVMSYIRRFDKSRNTKIYLILSLVIFFIGSLLWMILSFLSSGNVLPFGIVSDPFTFIAVSILARQRKQFKNLWNGTFYDQQFMDKQSRKTIQLSLMQNNQNKIDINQALLSGLTLGKKEKIDMNEIIQEPSQMQNEDRVQSVNLNESIGPLNRSKNNSQFEEGSQMNNK